MQKPITDKTIMFVDDEEEIANIAVMVFEDLGFKIESFNDPGVALKKFSEAPSNYFVIFTDFSMPTMKGDQFASGLRKIDSKTPIVLCTGLSVTDFGEEKRLRSLGITHFMPKPYGPDELEKTINIILASMI